MPEGPAMEEYFDSLHSPWFVDSSRKGYADMSPFSMDLSVWAFV